MAMRWVGWRFAPTSAISASWSTSPPPVLPGAPTDDAHARADEPGPAVEVERRLELQLDALGERQRRVRVACPGSSTANVSPPNRATVSPGRGRDAIRCADLAQDAVAGRVAEALVDDLEPVDVEQEDRDRLAASTPAGGGGASASTTRWISVSRVGRPVTGSRGESACSWSRAFSSAIEASWANLRQRVDLGLPEDALGRARREAEHADDAAADGERHADDRADHAR